MLNSKLIGKIRIFNDFELEQSKTNQLDKILQNILVETETAVLVTPKNQPFNFMKAQEALKYIKVINPNGLNVLDLLKHDKVTLFFIYKYIARKSLKIRNN